MPKLKVTMYLDVPNKADVEEIKKIEHHVDYLLNLDEYPEIESVFDVSIEEVNE